MKTQSNIIIISHPTGNANVREISKALANAGLLKKFITSIAVFENTLLFDLGKFKPFKELQRRVFSPILQPKTHIRPYRELGRSLAKKMGANWIISHERGFCSIDKVYKDLDLYVSKNLRECKAVYAYEDGALQSFKEAKSKGLVCLYDLPTGYWRAHRQFLEEEKQKRPEWAITLKCFQDSESKLARKDEELAMADAIFVASTLTKRTLELFPGKLAPIHIIPYGFPEVYKCRNYPIFDNRKLKLLFVGSLSQLKGIANVLEAAEMLIDKVELTIVGQRIVQNCIPLEDGLKKHTWISSMPHNEVLKLMRKHDIFVFPSLCEGYGLVISEAMSQGTPVITTNRTCGEDFIRDWENGWLVPPGDTKALINKIESILDDPECIAKVGRAAMETALQSPMNHYGQKMVKVIEKELKRLS